MFFYNLVRHMNLDIAGLRIIRSTERDTFVEFEVAAQPSCVAEVVSALLAVLPDGGEISVPAPGPYECYNECQRINGALQLKRGCQGSYGTWRFATTAEAHEWLLPGFKLAASDLRNEQILVRVQRTFA